MKALPKEPKFSQILNAPTPQELQALQNIQIAHDLRRVVLEGMTYFKDVDNGLIQPSVSDLNRYKLAAMQYQQHLAQHEWHDKELDDLIRGEVQ